MLTAKEIISCYIEFFEKREHKRIENAPLIPQNDPTTLFTSSGMQPLVPYLLGEPHPQGTRLVNVQNCFRAQDIDEIGNNRHTTFFRMLGNWSLGDYFKKEQLPWIFEFLTKELGLNPEKLYATVFEGNKEVEKDQESKNILKDLFDSVNIDSKEHIFYYGAEKNWWSRSGTPDKMPTGEPGGPDSEFFYDLGIELQMHEKSLWKNKECHVNCDCGRFIEICNSVFMQYKKEEDGSLSLLLKPNVDFGGGLERFLIAIESEPDIFKTNLFWPIIETVSEVTNKSYEENKQSMRILVDHFISACFIIAGGIIPSNKDQGYVLRRLIRRGFDSLQELRSFTIEQILESIVEQYKTANPNLVEKFEEIKNTILEETQKYENIKSEAKKFILKKYPSISSGQVKKMGDEFLGITEISSDDAFVLYTTHGLSPAQIKSLGYSFNQQEFAKKMKQHQALSRKGASQKFSGGLADHSQQTIMGHTATHLLHQALRDILGNNVHQTGSNITNGRLRFDFNYDKKLTDGEIKKIEEIVNDKIQKNLPVHFEMMSLDKAKEIGAIGLFDEKYQEQAKIYFIGGDKLVPAYSIEFCGGPHVAETAEIKNINIIKQENLGHGQRRIYAVVG